MKKRNLMRKLKMRNDPKGWVYFKMQPADRPILFSDELKVSTEDWDCIWDYKGHSRRLFVPSGYIYDGASVPRIFWSITGLRPDGAIRAASLAHDSLFRSKGGIKPEAMKGCRLTNDKEEDVFVTYKEANWVFLALMRFAQMDFLKYRIAYRAVCIGGRKHWGGPCPALRDNKYAKTKISKKKPRSY